MKKIVSMVLAMVMVLAVAASSASAAIINTAQLAQDVKDTASRTSKNLKDSVNFTPKKADGYWSSKFSQNGQTAYVLFVEAVKNFQSEVKIPKVNKSERDKFAQILQQEHPELFYVAKIGTKDGTESDGHEYQEMTITYESNAKSKYNAVINAANQILNGAPKSGSDYDKELYVHDRLVKDTTYQRGQKTIYNNLVEHKSNCMGYAYAMKYLLNKLGVDCRVVKGKATGEGDHMWNVVTLNGKEYLTDTGWDDPSGTTLHAPSYRYFNLTKDEMNRDHTPDNPSEESACTNSDQGYYKKNGMYYTSVADAENAIKNNIQSKKVMSLQLASNEMAQQVRKDFMDGKIVNANRGAEKDTRQNGVVNNVVVVYLK